MTGPSNGGRNSLLVWCAAATLLPMGGCVRRTLTITSEPSGAVVMLNDREVGRTPVEVDFLWYGDYDVRLSLEGHDPLVTLGTVEPPLWDIIPFDFLAEVSPGKHEVRRGLHYVLEPSIVDDAALVERAAQMRAATIVPQSEVAASSPTQ